MDTNTLTTAELLAVYVSAEIEEYCYDLESSRKAAVAALKSLEHMNVVPLDTSTGYTVTDLDSLTTENIC